MSNIPLDPWIWKMQWCKKKGLAPARNDVWDRAEVAFKDFLPKENEGDSDDC